jgi:hypothetical protein
MRRKSPEFPGDCAKFKGRNERSSQGCPQTRKKQEREDDSDRAYGDNLEGGPAVQFLNCAPDQGYPHYQAQKQKADAGPASGECGE